MKISKYFITIFIITILFSLNAEQVYAGKLTPKPVYTKLDLLNKNITEFSNSTKKLEDSLNKITQIFANERDLSESKRKSLLYVYTSMNELIKLSRDLAKFNMSIFLIFKGHEEINLDMQPAPPKTEDLQKILNNASASIKNIISVFKLESNKRVPRYQLDALKELNFNFYNYSLSSENLERSLYNVLKSYSIASTIIELRNINQSLLTYQLDMNESIPRLNDNSNQLNAEKLVISYRNDWAGPYAFYKISDNPGMLNHSVFGNIIIYAGNNGKWKNPLNKKAQCNKINNCFTYICFTKLTQMAKLNLEMKIDKTNSPDDGDFRYSSRGLGCFKGSRIK